MTYVEKRKVLLVSYLFPPIAGGGVPRPLKMCKYLPQYGWETVVLTVDPQYNVSLDQTLLDQIPEGTKIYRAGEWNPYQTLNRLRSATNRPPASSEERESKNKRASFISRLKSGVFQFIKKIKNYVLIPDDHIFWVPFAVRQGLKAIREQKAEVIFSTSGPYSSHLVAKKLAKKTGLPWIADFRDPWTQNMHRSGIAWRERLEEKMEKQVMEGADVITTVTESFADNFKAKYPRIKQMEVIYNGYDPEDYEQIHVDRIPNKLVFAYTGIFYQERNPRLFLRAVSELLAERQIRKEEILIRFAGVFDYPGYTENQDAVRELGLEDVVEVLGYLPHRQSLSLLKSSDVLLLINDTAPGSEAYIPGKLYEYLAVQRPILAFSLPGESTRIIDEFGLGRAVLPTDLAAMKEAILQFVTAWREGRLEERFTFQHDGDRLAKYRRDFQAQQLARVMNQILHSPAYQTSSDE